MNKQMKYFDKQGLDDKSMESIKEQLNTYQEIIWDRAVLEQYRAFYSEVMQELLEYAWDRNEKECIAKEKEQKEDNWEDDIPF